MLRICIAIAGVVLGLALTATSAHADTNPAPSGTSVGKLTHKARPGAAAKVVRKSQVAKVKIRIKAKAAPVRKVTRRVAPAHSYHASRVVQRVPRKAATVHRYRPAKVHRTAVKRSPRHVALHHRIFKAQRKNGAATVRAAHHAAPSKARLVHRAKVTQSKINKTTSKIIEPSVRKATTARTIPALAVGDLPVAHMAIITPEITVRVLPLQASISQVEVTVPLPLVGQPPIPLPVPLVEQPPATIPGTDPTTAIPSSGRATALEPLTQVGRRVSPIAGTAPAQGQETIPGTPQGILTAGVTMLTAHPSGPMLPVQAWAIASIGPPAIAIVERISTAVVPTSVGSTATALVLAAAIGAAATGTVGSGSSGWSGMAVVSAGLPLPALRGSRRLYDRLRESALRRSRQPGFSPD